jgi:hypothetical protein
MAHFRQALRSGSWLTVARIVPLLSRGAAGATRALGLIVLLLLYGLVLRRAVRDQIVASDKQRIAQA